MLGPRAWRRLPGGWSRRGTAGRARVVAGRPPGHSRYGPPVKVAVAFDHRGVHLRDAVFEALAAHDVVDLGTDTDAVRIDYPDKALEIGEAILAGEADRGVLVCG